MLMIIVFPYIIVLCYELNKGESIKEELPMYREEGYRNVHIDNDILMEMQNLITDERLCVNPLNL